MSRATTARRSILLGERTRCIEDARWRIAADVAWLLEHGDNKGVKDHLRWWEGVLYGLENADE